MAGIDFLIARGERLAQALRPATLVYAGKELPCTIANLDYTQKLEEGGFQSVQNLQVRLLRADIPDEIMAAGFHRAQSVTVTDHTSGDAFALVIGLANSRQGNVLILNLEKPVG